MQKPKFPDADEILKMFDALYTQSRDGIKHVSKSVPEVCDEYLRKYHDPEQAYKKFCKAQITKCTTSGFITGLGGLITLPVTIPANLSSVFYVQMRMIAGAAYMAGYDLYDDELRTFVYACLTGVSVNSILKQFGNEFGKKFTVQMIKKIPGETLHAINRKIGFRFITKFGQKGMINLGDMVPIVGGFVNGGLY